jgi:hypothetical protein
MSERGGAAYEHGEAESMYVQEEKSLRTERDILCTQILLLQKRQDDIQPIDIAHITR